MPNYQRKTIFLDVGSKDDFVTETEIDRLIAKGKPETRVTPILLREGLSRVELELKMNDDEKMPISKLKICGHGFPDKHYLSSDQSLSPRQHWSSNELACLVTNSSIFSAWRKHPSLKLPITIHACSAALSTAYQDSLNRSFAEALSYALFQKGVDVRLSAKLSGEYHNRLNGQKSAWSQPFLETTRFGDFISNYGGYILKYIADPPSFGSMEKKTIYLYSDSSAVWRYTLGDQKNKIRKTYELDKISAISSLIPASQVVDKAYLFREEIREKLIYSILCHAFAEHHPENGKILLLNDMALSESSSRKYHPIVRDAYVEKKYQILANLQLLSQHLELLNSYFNTITTVADTKVCFEKALQATINSLISGASNYLNARDAMQVFEREIKLDKYRELSRNAINTMKPIFISELIEQHDFLAQLCKQNSDYLDRLIIQTWETYIASSNTLTQLIHEYSSPLPIRLLFLGQCLLAKSQLLPANEQNSVITQIQSLYQKLRDKSSEPDFTPEQFQQFIMHRLIPASQDIINRYLIFPQYQGKDTQYIESRHYASVMQLEHAIANTYSISSNISPTLSLTENTISISSNNSPTLSLYALTHKPATMQCLIPRVYNAWADLGALLAQSPESRSQVVNTMLRKVYPTACAEEETRQKINEFCERLVGMGRPPSEKDFSLLTNLEQYYFITKLDRLPQSLREKQIYYMAQSSSSAAANAFLRAAARYGDEGIVKQALRWTHINVNSQNKEGKTAFAFAVEEGQVGAIKALLNCQDIAIDACSLGLNTAVKQGRLNILELLLGYDIINVNIRDSKENTPLIWAVVVGNLDAISILLKHINIDVTLKRSSGHTALMRAAYDGNINVSGQLLEYYAEKHINITETEIEFAIGNKEILTCFLAVATRANDTVAVRKILATNNVDVDTQYGTDKFTPLMLAVRNHHKELVQIFLDERADIGKTANGWTALHMAAIQDPDILILLLEYDSSLANSQIDDIGKTALMIAIQSQQVRSMQALLDVDESIYTTTDNNSDSAVDYAIASPNKEILSRLLLVATIANDTVAVRKLLNTDNVDVDQSVNEYTILMYHIYYGNVEIIQQLFAAGVKTTMFNSEDCTVKRYTQDPKVIALVKSCIATPTVSCVSTNASFFFSSYSGNVESSSDESSQIELPHPC